MISHVFGYPIWTCDEAYNLTPLEISHLRGLNRYQNKGMGGNYITDDQYILNKNQFSGIKEFCDRQINRYFHDVLHVVDETEIYMTQSWANFNKKGEGHHKHWHSNSIVSAVMWIQTDGTPINFYRDSELFPLEFDYKQSDINNSTKWWYNTVPGYMVIFPSSMKHDVPPNQSDIERISISMNTFVKGRIGPPFEERSGLVL